MRERLARLVVWGLAIGATFLAFVKWGQQVVIMYHDLTAMLRRIW